MAVKFEIGRLVTTPGAQEFMETNGISPVTLLERYLKCDWGDSSPHDKHANNNAVQGGGRIFAAYKFPGKGRLWIITEADRTSTCILLPEEY